MKNRRQFLLSGVLGLVAASTLPARSLAGPINFARRGRISSLADMDLATFQNLGRARFRVRLKKDRWASLDLFAVENHRPAKGEHFTLLFSGPAKGALGQDTYSFDHPTLGYFSLMIVPGRTTRTRQVYAALINRSA